MMLSFLAVILSVTSLVTAGPIQRRAVNEVISSNFPDPSILKVGTTWYSLATNSGGINIQIAKSLDFKSWAVISGKDALPNLPRWVNNTDPAVWAPDVIQNVCKHLMSLMIYIQIYHVAYANNLRIMANLCFTLALRAATTLDIVSA